MAYIKVRDSARKVRGRAVKRYTAVWTEDGREFGETFDTREAAQDALDRVKSLLAQGKSPASLRESGKATFGAVAAEWLAGRHDLKPRTRAEYTNLLATKTHARKTIDVATNSLVSTAELSIAAAFGTRQVNAITHKDVADWVGALGKAGKSASTIRHHYFVVNDVLKYAVTTGRLLGNPAEHVKLPTERTLANSSPGVVDDPDMFLSAMQVNALIEATPWPCAVMVHLAAWSGMRAAELGGLQVGDIEWPVNPNGTVFVRVRRTLIPNADSDPYDTTKTKNSDRRVPLMPHTAQLLRDYLAEHPRGNEPTAPLFCAVKLTPVKPTGKRRADASSEAPDSDGDTPTERKPETAAQKAERQAIALAALSVAQATDRLALDWSAPLSHQAFYKAVFRPAVLRANRLAHLAGHETDVLPTQFKFHGLRHTYASLCAAADIDVAEVSRNLGHSKVTTTQDIYTHLFRTDDSASAAMAKLAALAMPMGPKVVPLRRRG